MYEQGFIADRLIILTSQTVERFMQDTDFSDLLALYTFYYYTAKWQKTNQIKCTTGYTAKGMNWSEAKVRRIKKKLIDIGLASDITSKDDNGKITGHYVKLAYIFKSENVENIINSNDDTNSHTYENRQCGKSDSVANRETNALSNNNINALSNNNKNNIYTDFLERIWKLYPKKRGKSAITKKALKELHDAGEVRVLKAVENYISEIHRNHTSEQYIMNGSTFFNGRWKDYENESEEVNDNPYANVGTILR